MELKPGFKQTEVGAIPEDWDIKQLGLIAIYTNGKAHEKRIKEQGRYFVVNSKFISSEGETRKCSDDCFCPTSAGDVLMVMSDVPNGKAIAKCFYVDRDDCYTVNQRICALGPTRVDGKLLFYKLNRNPFYLAFDDGVKQTNLRKDDVLSCPLSIPKSVEEQRAIASALSDVDALIGALEQLIAKKRDLKQAAMQELLTGKKRLPGFETKPGFKQTEVGMIPKDWVARQLGDLFEITSSKRVFQSEWKAEGVPFYRAREVAVLGEKGSVANELFISRTMYDAFRTAFGVPRVGDILVTGVGTLGKTFLLADDQEFYFKDGNIIWFKIAGAVQPEFLRQLYLTCVVMKQISDASAGTTVGTYTISGAKKTIIPLPSKAEQNAIATVLSDMDAEIAALEQRRDKTRALKQGMMQELLTGKTRLV